MGQIKTLLSTQKIFSKDAITWKQLPISSWAFGLISTLADQSWDLLCQHIPYPDTEGNETIDGIFAIICQYICQDEFCWTKSSLQNCKYLR